MSVRVEQEYSFPAGTTAAPGEVIKIVSGRKAEPGKNTLLWTRAYIWNNDGDPEIYDADQNLICRCPASG